MATYVDRERGLISREIFVDEEIYRLEQERIFCKQWLFIGHESQIPKTAWKINSSSASAMFRLR